MSTVVYRTWTGTAFADSRMLGYSYDAGSDTYFIENVARGLGGDDVLSTSLPGSVWVGDRYATFTTTLGGGDGNDTLTGNAGTDSLSGGTGDDLLNAQAGGNDILNGDAGNDVIDMGASFTAADVIDGGAGTDRVILSGPYSARVTFGATTMVNVETLALGAGHTYKLTTDDATVAAGRTLTVDGAALGPANKLAFDGGSEADGSFELIGGAGDDVLTGGALGDLVDLTIGGRDRASGGGGDDSFALGTTLDAADAINGGSGYDTVIMDGDYSAGLALSSKTLTNIENLRFLAGHDYDVKTSTATVGAGRTLTVDGAALGTADVLTFSGGGETDGRFAMTGGAGNDVLTGGELDDRFDLTKGGDDAAYGGRGPDVFDLGAAFTADDRIDGGSGGGTMDTMLLDGDYSGGVSLSGSSFGSIERLSLASGHSYDLTAIGALGVLNNTVFVEAASFAAGEVLALNGSASDARFYVSAGAGDDVLVGAGRGDRFDLSRGGDDVAIGGGESDYFYMGAALTAADRIDGGYDRNSKNEPDTVRLDGDYSAGLVFAPTTIVRVHTLSLAGGHSYNLTTDDATFDHLDFVVNASALGAGDKLILNCAAATDGQLVVYGGAGNDTVTGGRGNVIYGNGGNDVFNLGLHGDKLAYGGDGNDVFNMGGELKYRDSVIGGTGVDKVRLDGDYSKGLTFGVLPYLGRPTMTEVEFLSLAQGHSYRLTTHDSTVAAGETLTVDAHELVAADVLTFDGSPELDGRFAITGGRAADSITAGAGDDWLRGGVGADRLNGGAGADTFAYDNLRDSMGLQHDTLVGFDATVDLIDLDVGVTGIDEKVNTGSLSEASFNADLAATVTADRLAASHAMLFKPNAGTLAGDFYLIVDANGAAGYQGGQDYVLHLEAHANVSALSTATFI
ncbi:MAG: hypothetical protein KIS73_09940 [Enhydrobacter sp.]|nr:hypothetical protein [Enhydrobacter sp.]